MCHYKPRFLFLLAVFTAFIVLAACGDSTFTANPAGPPAFLPVATSTATVSQMPSSVSTTQPTSIAATLTRNLPAVSPSARAATVQLDLTYPGSTELSYSKMVNPAITITKALATPDDYEMVAAFYRQSLAKWGYSVTWGRPSSVCSKGPINCADYHEVVVSFKNSGEIVGEVAVTNGDTLAKLQKISSQDDFTHLISQLKQGQSLIIYSFKS